MSCSAKREPNGTWHIQYRWTDWTGTKKKSQKRGFKTKKEAEEWYAHFILQQTSDPTMTLNDFWEIYKADMEKRLQKTTMKQKEYVMKDKVLPYFGNMPINAITAPMIRKWQGEMIDKGFKPTYLKTINNQLSSILNYAVRFYELRSNPCHKAGSMGKSKADERPYWTLEEFQKVISLLYKGDYYEHYLFMSFWLLFMTGMRIGEAAALHWSDIDFETGLLSITKTLYYKTMTDYKFVEPKTQASIRTIYIDADTLNELKAWKKVQQQVLPNCELVLSYNGTPTSKTTLPRALEKLAGLAGVHRIKIHALRHSHASLLISMGENPLLIKERLGHEKIQTTLGTYGHLYPNTNLEVANKLTGVLQYTPASQSVANYTSNQHTAVYHREVNEK